jgi:hypothetical protein
MNPLRVMIAAALLVSLGALGCSEEEQLGCRRDADCRTGFRCSPDRVCLCTTDQACGSGEYCNAEGSCQLFQGCRADADCGSPAGAWRCQIGSGAGQCLCVTNDACPADQVCNTAGSCQEKVGCVLDADCGAVVDWRCRINPATQIGECLCRQDGACDASEFCNTAGYCQPRTTCSTNEDCPAGRYCNQASGECLCNAEAQTGCRTTEVCNASGYCQPRPGCYDNQDCADLAGTFCDYTTRTCVPQGTCSSDMQCPIGQVCRQRVCTAGCNTSADCPLDERCVNFQCASGCQGDEFCDFMEFCNNGSCANAYSTQNPYCKACPGGIGGCGTMGNSCLIYPFTDPTQDAFVNANRSTANCEAISGQAGKYQCNYCAPSCEGGQRCPMGFRCSTVITIKQSDLCQTSANCPAGLPCLKSSEEDQGFCPCSASNRCPDNTCLMDTCGAFSRKCTALALSGYDVPCTTNADCQICTGTLRLCSSNADCPPLQCELYEGQNYGGCVSARSCGLMEGFRCDP